MSIEKILDAKTKHGTVHERLKQMRNSIIVVVPLNDDADKEIAATDILDSAAHPNNNRVQMFDIAGSAGSEDRDKLFDTMLGKFKPQLSEKLVNPDFGLYQLQVGGGDADGVPYPISRSNYFFHRGGSTSPHAFWINKHKDRVDGNWLAADKGQSFLKNIQDRLQSVTECVPQFSLLFRVLFKAATSSKELRSQYKVVQVANWAMPPEMPARMLDYILVENGGEFEVPNKDFEWAQSNNQIFEYTVDANRTPQLSPVATYQENVQVLMRDFRSILMGTDAGLGPLKNALEDQPEFADLRNKIKNASDSLRMIREMLPSRILPQETLRWLFYEAIQAIGYDPAAIDDKDEWAAFHRSMLEGSEDAGIKAPLAGNVLSKAEREKLDGEILSVFEGVSEAQRDENTETGKLLSAIDNALGTDSKSVITDLLKLGFDESVRERAYKLPFYSLEEHDQETSRTETSVVLRASVLKATQSNALELKSLRDLGDQLANAIDATAKNGALSEPERKDLAGRFGQQIVDEFIGLFGNVILDNADVWKTGRHLLDAAKANSESTMASDLSVMRRQDDYNQETGLPKTALGATDFKVTDEILDRFVQQWMKRYVDYDNFKRNLLFVKSVDEIVAEFEALEGAKDEERQQKTDELLKAIANCLQVCEFGSDDRTKQIEDETDLAEKVGHLQREATAARKRVEDLIGSAMNFASGKEYVQATNERKDSDKKLKRARARKNEAKEQITAAARAIDPEAARTAAQSELEKAEREVSELQGEDSRAEERLKTATNAEALKPETREVTLDSDADSEETRSLMEIFGVADSANLNPSDPNKVSEQRKVLEESYKNKGESIDIRSKLADAWRQSELMLANAYQVYEQSKGIPARREFCQDVDKMTLGKIMRSIGAKKLGFRKDGSKLLQLLSDLIKHTSHYSGDPANAKNFFANSSIVDYLDAGLFQGDSGKAGFVDLKKELEEATENSFKNIQSFISELQSLHWLFGTASSGTTIYVVNATASRFRDWYTRVNHETETLTHSFSDKGQHSAGLLVFSPLADFESDKTNWNTFELKSVNEDKYVIPPVIIPANAPVAAEWKAPVGGVRPTAISNLSGDHKTALTTAEGVAAPFPWYVVGPGIPINASNDKEFRTTISPVYLVAGSFLGSNIQFSTDLAAGTFNDHRVRTIYRDCNAISTAQGMLGEVTPLESNCSLPSDYFLYVILCMKLFGDATSPLDVFWRGQTTPTQSPWDQTDAVAEVHLPGSNLKSYRFDGDTQPSLNNKFELKQVSQDDATQLLPDTLDSAWFKVAYNSI